MYIPFKANDSDGNIHHLRVEYANTDETLSNMLRVVDRMEQTVQFNRSVHGIGRFVLQDGTKLDSNDKYSPT